MGPIPFGIGMAAVAAVLATTQALAQWNNEPYSYRSGGSTGMSTAYRQALIDQQISGNRPRNLLRAGDGSLLTVIENDGQAFAATPQPNYQVGRVGTLAGVAIGGVGVGISSAPIDAWVAQLDGLHRLE